ncbi:MAG: hypothetical protein SRB2_00697 [Desulfobacteraceae bacterium Eth-SRB2]|nr:MAG: hypothetical protein SRB2_00697 [Desulfobacteraceae bacterium Eth-SRB2]
MLNKKNTVIACLVFIFLVLTSASFAATLGTDTGNITINATAPVTALEIFGKNTSNGIAATFASTAGAKILYFPHFAVNETWWTGLAVSNLSTASSTSLSITAFDTAGNQLWTKGNITIDAGGQTPFMTIQDIFGSQAEGSGWLLLSSSTTDITAVEMFGSAQGIAALTPAISAGFNLYFPHFASNDQWWTGIAVANTSGASNIVRFTAYNESGTEIGRTAGITVPPFAQMPPRAVSDLFEGKVSGTGWIKMESTKRVVGMEIFGQKNGVNGIAGLTATGETETELYLPHFASDTQWWTGIAFANPLNQTANVTLTAYDTAGNQIGTAKQASIAALGQMKPELVANLFGGTVSGSGWIKATASSGVVGLEIFGRKSDSSIAGLTLSGGKNNTLYLPYFVNNSQWWTGVGVANPGTTSTAVSLTAKDANGDQVGNTANLNVPGSAQGPPQSVKTLFGLTGGTGSTNGNLKALNSFVAMAAAQEEAYADLLAIFSNDFTVPLFDTTVEADADDYDLLGEAIAKVVAAGDEYQEAINYFDQQNSLTPTAAARFSFISPSGILSSIKNFFWGWAKGSGERSSQRILQINAQMNGQTQQAMYNAAVAKFGADKVGKNHAELVQNLQNGNLNNQAHQLHSAILYDPNALDYLLYAQDNKMDTTSIAHQEGADGVTKGVDVVIDAATTVVNSKFDGFSDAFDKGKNAVEDANKLVEDPFGYAADKVKSELEGKASQWLQDKTGASADVADLAAEQASAQLQSFVKNQLVKDKTGDDKDKTIQDLDMGFVAPAYDEDDDKSKVHGMLVVPSTDPETGEALSEDELIFHTIIAILNELEEDQKLPTPPGGYNVQVVGDDNVNQVPNVQVPEDGGVVIAVSDDEPTVATYSLSASASPADPGPGVGVTATAVVQPAKSGLQVTFSIVGTDGYSNSGTLTTNSQGTVSFYIPGGAEGVVDTVIFTLVVTGQTVSFSYTF